MGRLAVWAAAAAIAAGTTACAETDAGVTTKVKSKLAADEIVKASDVEVTTEDRVVRLTGEVESEAAKTQAVRLTRETDGVRDVIDDLVVGTSGRADPLGSDVKPGQQAAPRELPGDRAQPGERGDEPARGDDGR
jgi:hypothetical protein